jgi:hypothetical protein
MRIALAIAGIAVAGVLVVSAAIAAGLVDTSPGPSSPKDKSGALGKARIMPLGMSPLKVKGTGFVPGEHVRVTETSGARVTRKATAGSRGGFVVTLPVNLRQSCGADVVAKGDKGSRARFNLAQFACAAPGTSG